jgi:hypothetical protein
MSVLSDHASGGASASLRRADAISFLSRDQLFAGLLIVASANGIASRALIFISGRGLGAGLYDTFGISLIVWIGWACACYLVVRDDRGVPASAANLVAAGFILLLIALPGPHLSWLIVFALSAYLIWTTPPDATQRKAAMIFLTLTVPMFWGPLAFNVAASSLLEIDAFLCGKIIGTQQVGNLVQFSDGVASFQIWPPCSSFHNISQAAVAWMTLSQGLGRRWSLYDMTWCVLAGLSAMAVNLGRLSLIGLYREHFDAIHGSPGYEIAGLLALVAIIVVCIVGLRREIFQHA